jgi:hypothetical protein
MNIREEAIVALIERFFSERVFGERRLQKLAAQLGAPPDLDPDRLARDRLTERLAKLDKAIAAQVRGLEAGVEHWAVRARIEELKSERMQCQAELAALPPAATDDNVQLNDCLDALPDIREALQKASLERKRAAYSALGGRRQRASGALRPRT